MSDSKYPRIIGGDNGNQNGGPESTCSPASTAFYKNIYEGLVTNFHVVELRRFQHPMGIQHDNMSSHNRFDRFDDRRLNVSGREYPC